MPYSDVGELERQNKTVTRGAGVREVYLASHNNEARVTRWIVD